MKIKKISLSILSFTIILLFNSTKVDAITARVVYNPVNVFISNILRIAPIILIIAYIIGALIYYKKSKKDKKQKVIELIIWLVIIAIIAIISYCCADAVFKAGATYTSSPLILE